MPSKKLASVPKDDPNYELWVHLLTQRERPPEPKSEEWRREHSRKIRLLYLDEPYNLP